MTGRDSPLQQSGQAAEEEFSAQPAAEPVQTCGSKTWVDIQLLDDQGNPVPGEAYRLTLPDGRVIEGRLDDQGLAGVDGIDPGDCKIEFPDLHRDTARLEG